MQYNGKDIYRVMLKDDEDGIFAISLVDDPAVEKDFVCFNTDKEFVRYAVENADEHLITGVVMLADVPIFRRKGDYEYYLIHPKETIKLMAEKMLNDHTFNNITIQHNGRLIDGMRLVEVYIKDEAKGINPNFIEGIPDGSLMATFKVEDPQLWDEVKNGKNLNGFSLEGLFSIERMENNKDKNNKKMNIIEKMMKKLVKFEQVATDNGMLLTNEGEELAVGVEVFVADGEDGYKAAEDGEYRLEDGRIVVVADGKVAEIKDAELVEPAVEDKVEEVAEEEVVVEEPVVEEPAVDERDVNAERIDQLQSAIDEIKAEIANIRSEIDAIRNDLAKLVQEPVVEPIVEEFEKAVVKETKANKAARLLSHIKN